MAKEVQKVSSLCAGEIDSRIQALDQLQISAYTIRGVSDALFSLTNETNDDNDVLRMLADVTFCQWEAIKSVEAFLESEIVSIVNEALSANNAQHT